MEERRDDMAGKANEIKQLRGETGMSQVKFAEYFEIPRRTIEDWERGIRIPPDYVVRLLAYKLAMEGLIGKDGGSNDEKGKGDS